MFPVVSSKMILQVLPQVIRTAKRLSTERALERIIRVMRHPVLSIEALATKGLVTIRTFHRLAARVDPHVVCQRLLCGEILIANATGAILVLLSVLLGRVTLQQLFVGKELVTVLALDQSGTGRRGVLRLIVKVQLVVGGELCRALGAVHGGTVALYVALYLFGRMRGD